uniref:(northern house mosquito) hypothetical protein n=1 Tax=Culex pipiens TaxID=7175 RepID=A0A8D8CC55_CULPI
MEPERLVLQLGWRHPAGDYVSRVLGSWDVIPNSASSEMLNLRNPVRDECLPSRGRRLDLAQRNHRIGPEVRFWLERERIGDFVVQVCEQKSRGQLQPGNSLLGIQLVLFRIRLICLLFFWLVLRRLLLRLLLRLRDWCDSRLGRKKVHHYFAVFVLSPHVQTRSVCFG